MAKKEWSYKGKTKEELVKMSLNELMAILPSRERRSLKRGMKTEHKKLLKSLNSNDKDVKTHSKDMVILPEMFGKLVKIHQGKEWVIVSITEEMIGHRLGEFVMTRKKVVHSAPGIGATRSSASLSVK